jgi:hypothetical protein
MSATQQQSSEVRSDHPEDEPTRKQAIERIEARRRFHVETALVAIGTVVLIVIWAFSEYHNAGGWPTSGFSQSSGIHDVWNYWIIYPLVAIALVFGTRAWFFYHHKPISEKEIQREVERQEGDR